MWPVKMKLGVARFTLHQTRVCPRSDRLPSRLGLTMSDRVVVDSLLRWETLDGRIADITNSHACVVIVLIGSLLLSQVRLRYQVLRCRNPRPYSENRLPRTCPLLSHVAICFIKMRPFITCHKRMRGWAKRASLIAHIAPQTIILGVS